MSKDLFVPRTLLLLVSLGMILPQARAETPAVRWQPHKPLDVVLLDGGLLLGQVVTPQGRPKSRVVVFIRQRGRDVSQVRTDDQGRFAVKGLRGGAYELVTGNTSKQVRAWSKTTSPPSVSQVAVLMVDGETVRGQVDGETVPGQFDGTIVRGQTEVLANEGPRFLGVRPWVWAGAATAIVLPIALDGENAS